MTLEVEAEFAGVSGADGNRNADEFDRTMHALNGCRIASLSSCLWFPNSAAKSLLAHEKQEEG